MDPVSLGDAIEVIRQQRKRIVELEVEMREHLEVNVARTNDVMTELSTYQGKLTFVSKQRPKVIHSLEVMFQRAGAQCSLFRHSLVQASLLCY